MDRTAGKGSPRMRLGGGRVLDERGIREVPPQIRERGRPVALRVEGETADAPGRRQNEAVAEGAGLPAIEQHQRSEEHTSELQSLMRKSYAVFCLDKKPT